MVKTVSPKRAGRNEPRPLSAWEGLATSSSRAGLAAGADSREREDVVGSRREDRVAVEVLGRREAMEVLRAVGRPSRPHEEWNDRLILEEELSELSGDLPLLRDAEARLPLIQKSRRLRVRVVRPVARVRRVLAGRCE